MILFEKTHIRLGGQITPTEIDGFLVLYEAASKGVVTSHLIQMEKQSHTDDEGNVDEWYERVGAMPTGTRQYSEDDFTGKILDKLHADYIAELQAQNPDVGFMATIEA